MQLDLKVAAGHYDRAAGLLPVTDPGRPAILVKAGRANVERGQLAEAERLLREAIAGYQTQHDAAGAGEATSRLAIVTIERGGTAEAGRLLDRAISLLEQVPPGDALAEAYASSGCYHAHGRPPRAGAGRGRQGPGGSGSWHPSCEPGRWSRGASRESRSATSAGSRTPGRRSGSPGPWRCPPRSPSSSGTWPSTNG